MAVLVTLVLWLPDAYILYRGQPGDAVAFLFLMHLAIVLVTYTVDACPASPFLHDRCIASPTVPTINSANRDARRAIKAREQGQARIRSVTTAVTTVSVITAGAVTLILPGSTHGAGIWPEHQADAAPNVQAGTVGVGSSRRPGSFRKQVKRDLGFRQSLLGYERLQP